MKSTRVSITFKVEGENQISDVILRKPENKVLNKTVVEIIKSLEEATAQTQVPIYREPLSENYDKALEYYARCLNNHVTALLALPLNKVRNSSDNYRIHFQGENICKKQPDGSHVCEGTICLGDARRFAANPKHATLEKRSDSREDVQLQFKIKYLFEDKGAP